MEAIMKAFEKLEKREERRKEALARLEEAKKKHGEGGHKQVTKHAYLQLIGMFMPKAKDYIDKQ